MYCPTGLVKDASNICAPCADICKSCSEGNNKFACTSYKCTGSYLYNSNCVTTCPAWTYQSKDANYSAILTCVDYVCASGC